MKRRACDCCTERRGRFLQCPGCEYRACRLCTERYLEQSAAVPACMSCRTRLAQPVVEAAIGKVKARRLFVDKRAAHLARVDEQFAAETMLHIMPLLKRLKEEYLAGIAVYAAKFPRQVRATARRLERRARGPAPSADPAGSDTGDDSDAEEEDDAEEDDDGYGEEGSPGEHEAVRLDDDDPSSDDDLRDEGAPDDQGGSGDDTEAEEREARHILAANEDRVRSHALQTARNRVHRIQRTIATTPMAHIIRHAERRANRGTAAATPTATGPPAAPADQRPRLFKCPATPCNGAFALGPAGGTCMVCDSKSCPRCLTWLRTPQDHTDHRCSREATDSARAIITTTKSCPRCHVPIQRASGCDQVGALLGRFAPSLTRP